MAEITSPLVVEREGLTRLLLTRVAVASVASVAAWVALTAASTVDAPIASDYGFVAVLPAGFWVGLVLLNVCLGIGLWDRSPHPVLLSFMTLLLIGVIYGAPAVATGTPRTEVAWRHLGIAGELTASGRIDPTIDAYFNWPGFFAGLGSLIQMTGLDPKTIALVAPVVNAALWAAGVALIVRTLTASAHHMWVAVWIFLLANWIDQDYLSPQAFTYFAYLVAIALLLSCLGATPQSPLREAVAAVGLRSGVRAWMRRPVPLETSPRTRVAALWIVAFLSVVMIVSHQLTPVMLAAAVCLLAITGRTATPRLAVVVLVLLAVWLSTAASTYLSGHPVLFASDGASGHSDVAQRIVGSAGHVHVAQMRSLLTAITFGLAALGALRLYRRGQLDLRPVMLMCFPFLMVPVQSYGGEMIMRAALFGLPFAAYLAAGLFIDARGALPERGVGVMVVLATALSVLLVTARYGNAAFDTFTPAEIEATRVMYQRAPQGALLLAGDHPTPWRYRDYAKFRYRTWTSMCQAPIEPVTCYGVLLDEARKGPAGAVLMLTRASEESLRMQGELSTTGFRAFEGLVAGRGDARLLFRNSDVRIYEFPGREHEPEGLVDVSGTPSAGSNDVG
jgi:hypothetical protein